jgi:predicted Zn-dependent protease
MYITVEAKYFNGKSSTSQQTLVSFNSTLKEIQLQCEDGSSFAWQLEYLQFERYGSLLEIRNKNYLGAVLKIDDNDFSDQFYAAMKHHKRLDIHARLISLGMLKISAIALSLFGLIVLAYFYILPPIAEKAASLLPESVDDKIAEMFMLAFLNENEIDSTKTRYLTQFASEVNLKNKKQLRFIVIKSTEVNAFALPDGQIVVFSGILNNMNSAEELVALLAHEASHINQRHSIKMLCKNLAGYVAVSLLFSDVNGVVAVLADNAQLLHSLSYSRVFEQKADELGLKILIENKLNPNGMVELFEQLEKESEIAIPKMMSSHPLTKDRMENMQKIISQSIYQVKENHKLNSLVELLCEKN